MNEQETSRISIIVPVYKVERYLDRCVKSIVNQTYKNLEIILVNDGSPDNCPSMCDKWSEQDKRIRVIHQKNKGLAEARNVAMDICTGDYILFVDSDDWISSSLCEEVLERMLEVDADVAVFGYLRCFKGSKKVLCDRDRYVDGEVTSGRIAFERLIRGEFNMSIWNKMYKRAVIQFLRFPAGKYFEDFPVLFQILNKSNRVCYVDKNYYFYEKRQESIVEGAGKKYAQDLFDNGKMVYQFLLEKEPGMRKEIDGWMQRLLNKAYRIGGDCQETRDIKELLRQQYSDQKKTRFLGGNEKSFWLWVKIKRRLKRSLPGRIGWKLKWRLIFDILGSSLRITGFYDIK